MLPAGTRLGPYEILSPIGAGGMGEVYRARDTKLNRDVALKLLPEVFVQDADRRARFTREAQLLASLNHPNIAAIFGIEDSGASHALVMELVDGEDLSALIARGPIALADTLPIARQIIDALEAAHEQGVVHRDLKPANIKVRNDGTVKVLDFGLAKALGPADSSTAPITNSPTMTARATAIGMIIGTAAYMAPEQARGRAVDRRADIWAFGVVLYEMLTGRRAFEGDDISITLANVLKDDVAWTSLPADLATSLRRLLRRCLEKDPKRRLSAIGDARLELDEREAAPASVSASAAVTTSRRSRWWPVAFAVVVVLWLATIMPAWRLFRAVPDAPRFEFSVDTPTASVGNATSTVSVAPDGSQLVFIAPGMVGGANMIWIRALGASELRALPGTEGAGQVFWSPDSHELGFYSPSPGKLRKVDVRGGPPQDVCDVSAGFSGATWNSTGDILFSLGTSNTTAVLFRVSATSGVTQPTEVAKPDANRQEVALLSPQFLPDGRHFLYLSWSTDPAQRAIVAASLGGGTPTRIVNAESRPLFVGPDWLLYVRAGTLFAQPFDVARLRVSGAAIPVADHVLANPANGRAAIGASDTGVLAFRTGSAGLMSELSWVDRAGKSLGTVGDAGRYEQVRLSPDEKHVVMSTIDETAGSHVLNTLDLGNNITSQLTFEAATVGDPVWSPDSASVMFESLQKGKRDFYQQTLGSRTTTAAFESAEDPKWLDDWSPDGKYVLFHAGPPSRLIAAQVPNGPPIILAHGTPGYEGAHFSPDGKWVAYQESSGGATEVWVAAFPAFDRRRRVSAHGGCQPWWRGDGRELFYLTPDGQMMSVAITPDPSKPDVLDFHAPTPLFQSTIARPNVTLDQYSVTRNGQRFLFLQPKHDQTAAVDPITVIVNWTTGLTKK
jgi:serine/threonine protein kinase/Tol biopolymer transport system component